MKKSYARVSSSLPSCQLKDVNGPKNEVKVNLGRQTDQDRSPE